MDVSDELFESFVPGVNTSRGGYLPVSQLHLGFEVRSNGTLFEEDNRMSMRPEPHPKNRIAADFVAVDVGVDES